MKPRPDINLPADTGNTPLHAAANNGDVALVTTLLRAPDINANPTNAQCEQATPLHLAVMHGQCHSGLTFRENKWRRLVLNRRITFTKLELVPAFLFIKPATKRDLLVNPIAAGTC